MKILTPLHRRLLGYLRRYFFPFTVLMGAAMIVVSSTEGAIIIIIRNFTNQLTVARSLSHLPLLSLGLLVIFIARAASAFAADYLEAYVVQKITLDLRDDLNESL